MSSFDLIAKRHPQDSEIPNAERAQAIALRLSLLNGTFYDHQRYPFHQEFVGKRFISIHDRKPNVPSGTNELKIQVQRQASMVYGDNRFPQVETANEEVRRLLEQFVVESEIVDREREAVVIGSTGSVARHLRVLAPPGEPARLFVDIYPTLYLTPTFDPYRPDTLIEMREKYKVRGKQLVELGYEVKEDDLNKQFWFQRIWDLNEEIWFIPWLCEAEREARQNGKVFEPQRDEAKCVRHGDGICPWIWTKNLPNGRGIDGECQFKAATDHAVNLDFLESQITAAVKYTMSPTMVIEKPGKNQTPAAEAVADGSQAKTTNGEQGVVKGPGTILTIDAQGKAYYLEISGEGIAKAKDVAKELRTAIIEAMHGDRVDPKEVTNGHQGAKSLEMLNQPLLMLAENLRSSYGASLLKLYKMVLKVSAKRDLYINDVLVPAGSLAPATDLKLRWGAFYSYSPQEKLSDAQALEILIKQGVISRETATDELASTYSIQDTAAERTKIAAEQAAEDARLIAVASAQQKSTASITGKVE